MRSCHNYLVFMMLYIKVSLFIWPSMSRLIAFACICIPRRLLAIGVSCKVFSDSLIIVIGRSFGSSTHHISFILGKQLFWWDWKLGRSLSTCVQVAIRCSHNLLQRFVVWFTEDKLLLYIHLIHVQRQTVWSSLEKMSSVTMTCCLRFVTNAVIAFIWHYSTATLTHSIIYINMTSWSLMTILMCSIIICITTLTCIDRQTRFLTACWLLILCNSPQVHFISWFIKWLILICKL